MADKELGIWGENTAAEYLTRAGYRILERNYRTRTGEIDIIACNERYVVFAEVKTRRSAGFACAMEYVTYTKQQRIRSAAMMWLSRSRCELQPRFDVIEIYPDAEGQPVFNVIENAFE